MAAGTYKMRAANSDKQNASKILTVPAWVGRVVPEDQEFVVDLTDKGILYVPVESAPADRVPSWCIRNGHR